MQLLREISILLKKDIKLDIEKKQVLIGYMLYMISAFFLIHNLDDSIGPRLWNVLFWVVILFVLIIISSKSFLGESSKRQLLYFTHFTPTAVIISKQLYSLILSFIFVILAFITFNFFNPVEIQNPQHYFIILALGTASISLVITFISSMATQVTGNSAALTAVLGLPLMIPLFLIIGQSSLGYVSDVVSVSFQKSVLILTVFDITILILSVLLFPVLWNE